MEKLPWKNETEFYDIHSKEIFSKFPFYHTSMIGETEEDFVKYIIKKARIYNQANVVDLGCGSGYLVASISDFTKSVGISTSSECIKQAKINYPQANFEIGNMENYSIKNATHFLALESIGYSNIRKTFENVFKNLNENGIFYIKDLFIYIYETEIQKERRKYWEHYWKFKGYTISEVLDIAYETGFKLLEFNNLSGKVSNKMFLETLKYNKIKYVSNQNISFLIPFEFVFQK